MKIPAELLEQVRNSIRIKNGNLDEIIQSDVEAGALDMRRVGIQVLTESDELRKDALLYKALELYVKAEEDFQGKGEQYRKNYESLRDALSLDGEHREK